MNILDRFRVARLKRDLAALRAEDERDRRGETTNALMDRVLARAQRIAELQADIRRIEGEVDIDPDDPDDTRIPSGMRCPSTKWEERDGA